MKINGKTALVTGANRGIGFAIVNALLKSGVNKVYAAARDTSKLPDFEDVRVEPLQLDITDAAQIDQAVKSASDIDLLINAFRKVWAKKIAEEVAAHPPEVIEIRNAIL